MLFSIIKKLSYYSSVLILVSCSTPSVKYFNEIKEGMDKGEVLEILGSPRVSERFGGGDVWRYHFYDGKNKTIKEVHFKEGKVIFQGEPQSLDPTGKYQRKEKVWPPPDEKDNKEQEDEVVPEFEEIN